MVKVELPAFDTLRYLAEHDPERLEHLRHALTELLISRSPEESRQRLRGLQFQVNARINLAPNPVAACIAVSSMMHETLDQLQQVLTEGPDYPPPAHEARILPFRRTAATAADPERPA
jgi:hypothetical protein